MEINWHNFKVWKQAGDSFIWLSLAVERHFDFGHRTENKTALSDIKR
jgi:hypothetical protein